MAIKLGEVKQVVSKSFSSYWSLEISISLKEQLTSLINLKSFYFQTSFNMFYRLATSAQER